VHEPAVLALSFYGWLGLVDFVIVLPFGCSPWGRGWMEGWVEMHGARKKDEVDEKSRIRSRVMLYISERDEIYSPFISYLHLVIKVSEPPSYAHSISLVSSTRRIESRPFAMAFANPCLRFVHPTTTMNRAGPPISSKWEVGLPAPAQVARSWLNV
jgi:hypothetical protein